VAKAIKGSTVKGQIVGRQEIADIFGVSGPTVDAWLRAGAPYITKGSKGISWEINTAEIHEWLINKNVDEATGKTQADEATIDRRMKLAKMLRVELNLEKEKKLVAPIDEMVQALTVVFAEMRAALRIIPGRVYSALVGETDETRFKSVIQAEIDNALKELTTDKVLKGIEGPGDGNDDEEEDDENDS